MIKRHQLAAFLAMVFTISWGLGLTFLLVPANLIALFGPPAINKPLFLRLPHRPLTSKGFDPIRIRSTIHVPISYIAMLTAFYVDNGRNLPIWRDLPHIAYWLVPSAVGVPLIVRALTHEPKVAIRTGETPL